MFDLIHANRRLQMSNPSGSVAIPDVTPAQVNAALWFSLRDATKAFSDNGVTQAVAADPIQRVNNKGTEARFLMQTTLADRPLLSNINGQPAALYDGVNDFFLTDDWIAAHAQPFTIVYGGLFTNAAGSIGNAMGGTGFNNIVFGAELGGTYRMYAGATADGGARDALPHCFIAEYNGVSSTLQIDSAAPLAMNPSTAGFTGGQLFLGSDNSGSLQFKAGKFADFALIDGLVAGASKPGLVQYIRKGLGL